VITWKLETLWKMHGKTYGTGAVVVANRQFEEASALALFLLDLILVQYIY
jgi:hypothetical protein